LLAAFGSPYQSRPNGSTSEIRLTPRLSLRGQAVGSGLRDDFQRKLGKISPDVLKEVREALLFAIEMA